MIAEIDCHQAMMIVADLEELVERRLDAAGSAWLREGIAVLASPDPVDAFLASFATAGRRLGKAALRPTAEECDRLRAGGMTWSITGRSLDEAGRALLLTSAAASLSVDRLHHLLTGSCPTDSMAAAQRKRGGSLRTHATDKQMVETS